MSLRTGRYVRPQRETGASGLAAKILALLKRVPGTAWRRHPIGAMQRRGDPDIDGVVFGLAVFIEVKLPGNEPTPIQHVRLKSWREAGAFTFVVHSEEEAREAVQEVLHFAHQVGLDQQPIGRTA